MYFSKKNRLNLVTLLLLSAHIEHLHETGNLEEWFGKKGAGWMKQAKTLVVKAFEEGLAPKLTQEDAGKIHKEALGYNLHVMSNDEKNLYVPLQVVYTMAEKAIGNTCSGCQIVKYKQCDLYQGLEVMEIPPACNEKSVCPYRQ